MWKTGPGVGDGEKTGDRAQASFTSSPSVDGGEDRWGGACTSFAHELVGTPALRDPIRLVTKEVAGCSRPRQLIPANPLNLCPRTPYL